LFQKEVAEKKETVYNRVSKTERRERARIITLYIPFLTWFIISWSLCETRTLPRAEEMVYVSSCQLVFKLRNYSRDFVLRVIGTTLCK
jgi:hypothetical protein